MTKLILIAVLGLAVATANGFHDDDKVVKFFAQTKTFVQLLIAKYLLNEAQSFFVELVCHKPVLDGCDCHYQASVHCSMQCR